MGPQQRFSLSGDSLQVCRPVQGEHCKEEEEEEEEEKELILRQNKKGTWEHKERCNVGESMGFSFRRCISFHVNAAGADLPFL